MKQCTQCGFLKDKTEFSKRSVSKDGLQPRCKQCNSKNNAKFREKHPEYKKEWDKANPGAQTEIVKKHYHKNPLKSRYYINKYYARMGMGVYKITCDITQDFYVGYSSQLQARYNIYLRGDMTKKDNVNRNLWEAIIKYGKENFIFEILEKVKDKSMLIEREKYWIQKLNPTYNIKK